ncbi:MAG: hypothetical protein JW757_00590 [Anaerolineales bacterium]|nr:hypothetical protein [Anaerolineales bacterium]
MEDKKKLGMILTIVTVLLCGCPGLCLAGTGIFFSFSDAIESAGGEVTGNPEALVIPLICVGILGILITAGAGVYWFLQSRKQTESEEISVPDPLDGELD